MIDTETTGLYSSDRIVEISIVTLSLDGDVVDIALNVVKVQNWDRTFTVIPTHKFLEHSFKNWRGMSTAGGRRIKRAVYIDYGPAESATRPQLTCLSSAPGSKTVTPAEHLPTVVAQLQAPTPSAQPVPVPRTADPIPERVQRVVEEHLRSIPTSEIGRPIPARELWDAYMKGIDQLPDMPLLMDAFTDALGDGWTVVGRENADDDWYEKPVVNNYAWHWTA